MNVIPIPPRTTLDPDLWFTGGCPQCGRSTGYADDGETKWHYCGTHRVRWAIESRPPSAFEPARLQDDISVLWRIRAYEIVQPLLDPHPTLAPHSDNDNGGWPALQPAPPRNVTLSEHELHLLCRQLELSAELAAAAGDFAAADRLATRAASLRNDEGRG